VTPGQRDGGGAGEIEVVARADDAAGEKDGRREQRRGSGDARTHQSEPHEEKRDDRGGEDFKETFHPEMYDPPPPVFHDCEVRVLAPSQSRAIEEGDGGSCHKEQRDELLLASLPA